jgi:hypothetical protein
VNHYDRLFALNLTAAQKADLRVDETMTDPSAWQGKPLQLHGYVVENSVFAKKGRLMTVGGEAVLRQVDA